MRACVGGGCEGVRACVCIFICKHEHQHTAGMHYTLHLYQSFL